VFQRLGILGRLLSIALLVLFAALAIGTGAGIVSRADRTGANARLPLPDQIAALVKLLESEPARERQTVLRAANSDVLSVSISQTLPKSPDEGRRMPGVEWLLDQYFDQPGERRVFAWDEVFGRTFWLSLVSGEIFNPLKRTVLLAIELKSGGYAVFETRSEIVRIAGLPIGFWAAVFGAAIGVIAIRAIIREARPLKLLAASVEEFANHAKPVPVTCKQGARETQALIVAVNDMQTRIADLVSNRTLLLGAISHDLKTYITRLRLRVEQIPDAIQCEKAERDLDEMTQLLDDALAIAKGDGKPGREGLIDIAALVRSEAADRVSVSLGAMPEAGQSCLMLGDAVSLRRVARNLLDNAERFASAAQLSLLCKAGTIELILDDNGPGIAPPYREAVFDPFYRIEPSRNRETGGSGLGLAIARQIIEAHGGTIVATDSPMGGARFVVTLPAEADEPFTHCYGQGGLQKTDRKISVPL
jgi:signal transduction histidine kinase